MKWLAAALAALSVAACTKSSSSASSTAPSTKTTDTFTGTVAVKGTDSHTFTVAGAGEVDVTLTTANPSVPLGLLVGTSSGSDCVAVANGSVVASPGTTAQLSGVMSPASYCVAVFDVGGATQSVSYTVTVAHY
jgi:hypothetical protein